MKPIDNDMLSATPENHNLEGQIRLLRQMVEENQKTLQSIKHHMLLSSILGTIRILVIVIPLILAVIYLPTLIQQTVQAFQNSMNPYQQSSTTSPLDLTELQKMLQSSGLIER